MNAWNNSPKTYHLWIILVDTVVLENSIPNFVPKSLSRMQADKSVFQLYKSGVMNSPACDNRMKHLFLPALS